MAGRDRSTKPQPVLCCYNDIPSAKVSTNVSLAPHFDSVLPVVYILGLANISLSSMHGDISILVAVLSV